MKARPKQTSKAARPAAHRATLPIVRLAWKREGPLAELVVRIAPAESV